jgi:hypothetical protein
LHSPGSDTNGSFWLPNGMADIRLVRPKGPRIWLWTGVLAALGLALWSSAFFFGDATESVHGVGADLGLGEERAPVLPALAVPLHSLDPLQARDLGRLLHVSGVAQSVVRANAVWVRTQGGRRILVRFEPAPPPESLRGIAPGSSIELDGYLEKISRAEFEVWMDTLGVSVPRPPPGRKFGDMPDPGFARVDSLFVKLFYISVRPEALQARARPAPAS